MKSDTWVTLIIIAIMFGGGFALGYLAMPHPIEVQEPDLVNSYVRGKSITEIQSRTIYKLEFARFSDNIFLEVSKSVYDLYKVNDQVQLILLAGEWHLLVY